MQHPSVSWHIILLKLSNWNIMCFGQKEPISIQFFRFLCALIKVHSIPQAILKTARSRFIKTLHHWSLSWKITPLYFSAQTLYTLDKNSPSKWNFWTFEWLGENSPNSSCYILNHELLFLRTLHHSSISWEMSLLQFF